MASMLACGRCGSKVSAGARFCMNCGQALAPPASATATPGDGGAAALPMPRRISPVWWAIGAVLAACAVLAGLGAMGVLGLAGPKKTDPVLSRGQGPAASILQRPGERTAPVLKRDQITMPADVRAWLEHLERIEKAKQELQREQADELMIAMSSMNGLVSGFGIEGLLDEETTGDPEASIEKFMPIEKMIGQWKALRRRFNEEGPPVPAECRDLRDHYDGVLMQVPGVMKDIATIAGNVFDPSKSQKMKDLREVQREHRQYIDEPLRRSDDILGQICDRYDTRKWFDIKVDSGGMMGLPGLQ
ncbi:MAG TPA: zinc ribbon domain-containing protein [Fimbriimonadaceae bacterium]|nr:zinc ribbon domain-containing protein [Fimbriimonadaceae bacterium]HRJ97615.1 zinc ribbon domain-containing protein [Fimbriimonadaceae bacterium]